jgi:hypothetical protein
MPSVSAEPLEEGQGQALARVAVRGVGEGNLGEAAEFGDRGDAFEDLAEEQAGSGLGCEQTLATAQPELAAQRLKERSIDESGGSTLEAFEGLRHTEHGSLLVMRAG